MEVLDNTMVIIILQYISAEKEMATHANIIAWRIPWTEEPGSLQFMGLQRVRHDYVTSLTHSLTQYRSVLN